MYTPREHAARAAQTSPRRRRHAHFFGVDGTESILVELYLRQVGDGGGFEHVPKHLRRDLLLGHHAQCRRPHLRGTTPTYQESKRGGEKELSTSRGLLWMHMGSACRVTFKQRCGFHPSFDFKVPSHTLSPPQGIQAFWTPLRLISRKSYIVFRVRWLRYCGCARYLHRGISICYRSNRGPS
jgi:hypothetical protein